MLIPGHPSGLRFFFFLFSSRVVLNSELEIRVLCSTHVSVRRAGSAARFICVFDEGIALKSCMIEEIEKITRDMTAKAKSKNM